MALAMVANGASGSTLVEFAKTLHFQDKSIEEVNTFLQESSNRLRKDSSAQINIASGIWVDPKLTVKEEFVKKIKTVFDGEVASLNTPKEINDWVAAKTQGKIQNLISDLNRIEFVLVNAVYFKALFEHQFPKGNTADSDFFLLDGSKKAIKMMSQKTKFQYFESELFQIVHLPYKGTTLMATVVLPKEGISFEKVLNHFQEKPLSSISSSVAKVNLSLPRFKVEWGAESLVKPLSELGLSQAFTDNAQFPGISSVSLKISDVLHKTFVEVNEEGTEAAAATAVMMTRCLVMTKTPTVTMIVNRPFIFTIQNPDSLLFAGIITDV